MVKNLDKKINIAKRIARELKDGDVVNLGIGLPTLVADYVPEDITIFLHSENGMFGLGPAPEKGKEDPELTNAGGVPVTIETGGCYFDSPTSFTYVRGGHIDLTVLGTLEVDEVGNIANWCAPGKFMAGMGGAMDLTIGAKKVIVATMHTQNGEPKILDKCTIPLTGAGCVDMIVSEYCVMEFIEGKLVLKELSKDITLEEFKEITPANYVVSEDLKRV